VFSFKADFPEDRGLGLLCWLRRGVGGWVAGLWAPFESCKGPSAYPVPLALWLGNIIIPAVRCTAVISRTAVLSIIATANVDNNRRCAEG
jgi:hypothetical protein